MDMVFHAADSVAFRALVADELRHVGEELFACFFIEKWHAVFCAEYDVNEVDG